MSECRWTVVALTCGPSSSCDALLQELTARQNKGLIDKDATLLVIDDPVEGIGSGGATLNALLVITEHLAAKAGYTIVNSDVLDQARILILHIGSAPQPDLDEGLGRQYVFNSTGRAFLSIPDKNSSQCDGLTTGLDKLIHQMTHQVARGGPPGVWVCSTDMILTIPAEFRIDWTKCSRQDVVALSVRGTAEDAMEHGVYVTNEDGRVESILYKSRLDTIQSYCDDDGLINLVIGVVYFNKRSTEKLLSFHTLAPLNSCTYVGIDSGATPIQVSLFFDLLYAMCSNKPADSAVSVKMPPEQYKVKWRLLRKILSSLTIQAVTIENGEYHYLFNNKLCFSQAVKLPSASTIVNSMIAEELSLPSGCYISNSKLTREVALSENVFINHVDFTIYPACERLSIRPGTVYQQFRLKLNEQCSNEEIVPVIFGTDDVFEESNDSMTICNEQIHDFLERTGLVTADLWPPELLASPDKCTLYTARLYPVMCFGSAVSADPLLWMQAGEPVSPDHVKIWKKSWRLSMSEILTLVDFCSEFLWRRQLFTEIVMLKVKVTLESNKEYNLLSLYKSIASEQPEYCSRILAVLDQVAIETKSPGIAARALANIADVLGCMAGSKGGLRSGPSANAQWKQSFTLLERGEITQGVVSMATVRQRWMSRSDHLIRAARHYEGAAQILIRIAVMSARQYISLTPSDTLPPIDRWIVGESPARADIAGGWSDTPPISYEHGGAVSNAALLVDNEKPIGCKARRISSYKLVLVMKSGSESTRLIINSLSDLSDYSQPQSPGCLLKAAFVCTEIIDIASEHTLSTQLQKKYNSGFELHTWSNLPHGSGLGTSSILAGAVMAVLWTVSGQTYDSSSLVHSVLHLEQMMTTGGGWQDQIGGIIPGFKLGESKARLPLLVTYKEIKVSEEFLQQFNDRFLLVYTGKTRLARNLLQNVLRNWYARDPHIVETEDSLVAVAHQAAQAIQNGDLQEIGRIWTKYWELKKCMATGCEPASVTQMIKALEPYVLSCCMAGAGGGGFLYVLTKHPNQRELVDEVLSKLDLPEAYSIHTAAVCMDGLTVHESS